MSRKSLFPEVDFANFDMATNTIEQIGDGVIAEISQACGLETPASPDVQYFDELTSVVGQKPTLQDNISSMRKLMHDTHSDPSLTVRRWVQRGGLMRVVDRSYMFPESRTPRDIDVALISGGVRNWMARRADLFSTALPHVPSLILVGGNREMRTVEGDDVEEGMTEGDYLETVVKPHLIKRVKSDIVVVKPETKVGDEVMKSGVAEIGSNQKVVLPVNAGSWVMNGGQLRRAMQETHPDFDTDGSQLFVVSDKFQLGFDQGEPTATHQNPYSALAMIPRSAQEVLRQQK